MSVSDSEKETVSKFVSIRKKFILRISIILTLSFLMVLSVVAVTNYEESKRSLSKTEQSIRDSLIAKGRTLSINNSQALKGMAEDNAFSAVQALVTATVSDDEDIVYGIFMDADRVPWTIANEDTPDGIVESYAELEDEASVWANQLSQPDYQLYKEGTIELYEFAAPVVVEDEVLGTIRYGFSTAQMHEALESAFSAARQLLIQTLTMLGAVGVAALSLGFFATKKIATNITTPIGMLMGAAETIAKGDYDKEIELESNDEIGLLAKNFDTMRLTVQKKVKDLGELNATGEILAVLLDQSKALEEVLQRMHRHTNVNRGSIYLARDDNSFELKSYFPEFPNTNDRGPKVFAYGEGILGTAAKEKSIIFVENTSEDSKYSDFEGNADGKALICIPLVDNEIVIGVINLSGEVGEVSFDEADYEFASAIARLLVTTVKNIRMREVIEEQNRTLEQKVEARTAALQEKTDDIVNMMQNMHQGLFTVQDNLTIHHEYASYLETIFETNRIADRNVMDLLFSQCDMGSDRLDQVETAILSLVGEEALMFSFNSHLLPLEYKATLPSGCEKILALEWDPMVVNDLIVKLMVTVRDVTELKELEHAAEEQKKELAIIGQILSHGASKFRQFVQMSRKFIKQNKSLILTAEYQDDEVISELFRNMHTIKGNARTYGYNYITNVVHDAETTYDRLRKADQPAWGTNLLLKELDAVSRWVNNYVEIAESKLSIQIDESDDSSSESVALGVDLKPVENVLGQLQTLLKNSDLKPELRKVIEGSSSELSKIGAKPLENVLSGVIQSIPSLSKELGKPNPEFCIRADNLYMKPSSFPLLNNVFSHIFRNSLDHGIETPEERIQAGKKAEGTLYLEAECDEKDLVLTVGDDGSGLNVERIKSKLLDQGLISPEQELNQDDISRAIFTSGLSTAKQVTAVSGRGVGMDAVKKFIEQQGGEIDIVLKQEEQEHGPFIPFDLKIKLPDAMFYAA